MNLIFTFNIENIETMVLCGEYDIVEEVVIVDMYDLSLEEEKVLVHGEGLCGLVVDELGVVLEEPLDVGVFVADDQVHLGHEEVLDGGLHLLAQNHLHVRHDHILHVHGHAHGRAWAQVLLGQT